MQCPRCGFENISSSPYCEQCGTLINDTVFTLDQAEYSVPPPPPLNGHQKLPLPPPPQPEDDLAPPPIEYSSYGTQSQILTNQKIISRPSIGLFSAILYFIGITIADFGLIGTLTTIFGTDARIGGIGLLAALILLFASVVFFIRVRGRYPFLRGWQRILWICGATLGAFVALIFEVIIFSNQTVTNYFTGCVILLYGLAWAAIAIW